VESTAGENGFTSASLVVDFGDYFVHHVVEGWRIVVLSVALPQKGGKSLLGRGHYYYLMADPIASIVVSQHS